MHVLDLVRMRWLILLDALRNSTLATGHQVLVFLLMLLIMATVASDHAWRKRCPCLSSLIYICVS